MGDKKMSRQSAKHAMKTALSVLLSASLVWGSMPTSWLAYAEEAEEAVVVSAEPEEVTEESGVVEEEAMATPADEAETVDEASDSDAGEKEEQGAATDKASADEAAEEEIQKESPEEEDAPEEEPSQVRALAAPLRAPAPNSPEYKETLDTRSLGITLNLFDYEAEDIYNNNKYENPSYTYINKNKGLTTNLMFFAAGGFDQNHPTQNNLNQFTGKDPIGGGYAMQYANQGIVKSELVDGYPVLNTSGGGSLKYLFDESNIQNSGEGKKAKTAYNDVNNLFYVKNNVEIDGVTYRELMVYDSNEAYAVYDTEGNEGRNFRVYDGTFNRAGGGTDGMKVGFFPFDEPTAGNWSGTDEPEINATNTGNNPPAVNHHLGLSMVNPFTMPLDGKIQYDDGRSDDAVFSFSGDDDMWVFIDDHLVLDIGGIHQPVKGTINLNTGLVKLGSGTATPKVQNNYSREAVGIAQSGVALGDTAYLWNVYEFEADGITPKRFVGNGEEPLKRGILGDKNSVANRAGTDHTLKCFYLERGGCDSNLKVSTNLHLLTKKFVSVEKCWPNMDQGAISDKEVTVELVRKAVNRSNPDDVQYEAVERIELNAENDWSDSWNGLPIGGYLSEESGAPYYDYSYFVREHPVPEGFDVTYKGNDSVLTSSEMEYWTHPDGTQEFIGVSIENTPVSIVNTHTYLSVEKKWLGADGKLDTADHSQDEVWVQLYEQTLDSDNNKWLPEEGTPVGSPAKLNAAVEWSHVFDIANKRDDVRYFVKEGTVEGDGDEKTFIPSETIMTEQGVRYALDGVTYTRKYAEFTEEHKTFEMNDGSHNVSERDYYWISRDYYGNWLISRVFDGTTVAKQDGGEERQTFESDQISVALTIPPGAEEIPEEPSSSYDYVAVVSFDDKLVVDGDPVITGIEGATVTKVEDGKYKVTVPAETAKNKHGHTFSFDVTVKKSGGGDLSELTSAHASHIMVQQTEYNVTVVPSNYELKDDATVYTDGVVVTQFGTAHAVITNKPALTSVTIQKQWSDGKDKHSGDSIYVQLYKDSVPYGDAVELKDNNSWSHTFTGLPSKEGVKYTAAEGLMTDSGFQSVTGPFDVSSGRVKPISVAYYDAGSETPRHDSFLDGEIMPNAGSIVFTNGPVLAKINLIKVDADAENTPVAEVTFELLKAAEGEVTNDGTTYDSTKQHDKVTAAGGATTFTTDGEGKIALPDLIPGTYWLQETSAPEGYLVRNSSHPVGIVVDGDGAVTLVEDEADTYKSKATIQLNEETGTYTLTVPNVHTYSLPAAGGPGTIPFLIAGAFMGTYAIGEMRDDRRHGKAVGLHTSHK